jgi:hypothetical protein
LAHEYVVADGLHDAVSVMVWPGWAVLGVAVRLHIGVAPEAVVTVTVALAEFPATPDAFRPETEYVVVSEGETGPLAEFAEKPVFVHAYDAAVGVHDAASVDVPPAAMEDGVAVRVHVGTPADGGLTVTATLAVFPETPAEFLPTTE